MKKPKAASVQIRDRIKELRRVKASELSPSPKNWRTHPKAQVDALSGILTEVGYADALLARELPDGSLEIIDGHCRRELTPDQEVPVLILDLDEAEAAKLMTVLDPLAAMAEANEQALGELLAGLDTENEALQAMLDGLAAEYGIETGEGLVELRPLDTKPPPAMTWVLIGISTVRFGEVAETIQGLADIEEIVLESTYNDG